MASNLVVEGFAQLLQCEAARSASLWEVRRPFREQSARRHAADEAHENISGKFEGWGAETSSSRGSVLARDLRLRGTAPQGHSYAPPTKGWIITRTSHIIREQEHVDTDRNIIVPVSFDISF